MNTAAIERGFARPGRGKCRYLSQTLAVSITVAERMRTVVKLAGSISVGARANRHRIEFAEKHSKAILVSAAVRATSLVSATFRDMPGQPGGILPNTREERGVHAGEPLQADEVQTRHLGD